MQPKLTLMIEGSPLVLSAILASLPDEATVTFPGFSTGTITPEQVQGNGLSTNTGTGTPDAPALPMPSVPTMAAPTPIAAPQPMPPIATNSDAEDDAPGFAPTGDTDSNGLPWDERIHAGTKTTNQDGSWKKRKGVDKALVVQVENELRARNMVPVPIPAAVPISGAPAPTPAPAPQPMPMPVVPMNPQPEVAPTPVPQPMAMPLPVAAPAPTPAPATDAPVDMMGLMSKIAALSTAGTIGADYIAGLAQRVGQAYQMQIGAITDIGGQQHLIDYAVTLMKHDGVWG